MEKDLWRSGGFTLIELLVVIAIISLISSISVIAVNNARDRSRDNAIRADLSQVRIEATIIHTQSGSYIVSDNCLCDTDNTLNDGNINHPALAEIEEAVKKLNGDQEVSCFAETDSYCVSSPLASGETYCVDSTGYAGTIKSSCDSSGRCQVPSEESPSNGSASPTVAVM